MEQRRQNKYKIDISSTDTYSKFYKKLVKNPVKKTTYTDILRDFYQCVVDEILLKDKIFYIPENFGIILLDWKEPRIEVDKESLKVSADTSPVDWRATIDYWNKNPEAKTNLEYIRHDNSHSKGRFAKIKWSRKLTTIPGLSPYSYVPARTFKRSLANKIKSGEL